MAPNLSDDLRRNRSERIISNEQNNTQNNTAMKHATYTLTTEQLTDIIDDAFRLGKIYTTDELNTCRPLSTRDIPVFDDSDHWASWLDEKNGHSLHSGDAKTDILYKHLQGILRERFAQTVDFD